MRITTSGILRTSLLGPRSVLALGLTIGLAVPATRAAAQTAAPDPAPAPEPTATTPAAGDSPTGTTPATRPPQAVVDANPLAEQQLEQIRKMVSALPRPFVFDGYVRAGIGANIRGGDADAFQAPGAPSKFRLGNEVETYGELGFTANWVNPEHNEAWFLTKVKLAVVAPRDSTFDTLNAIAIREAYGEAGHVWDAHPETTFWAGQRFYRRRDSHIIDFFFNDTSGYGAGFQDMKIGKDATLSVAYLAGSTETVNGQGSANVGRLLKNAFDIRFSNIPAGPGQLEVYLLPTIGVQGDGTGGTNHSGFAGGLFYFVPMKGGFNEISGQFGYAGSANLSESYDGSIASDGWLFRLVDRGLTQVNDKLSLFWSGVLQFDNRDGDNPAQTSLGNTWVSLGARPVYMLSKYMGVAVEGGVDFVKGQADSSQNEFLGKLTVAGLIRPANDFWARPELRVFLTGAAWNDGAKNVGIVTNQPVGGAPFAGDNAGMTAGVQMESWW
jgi:maltoporin